MIKIGTRFINISHDHLVLAAQIGVETGVIRLESFPGFKDTGRPDVGQERWFAPLTPAV